MKTSFIVFSDDWGQHPSSCQHLFRHIAAEYTVLWVNTIGMRKPKLKVTDIKKAYTKIMRMFRSENNTSRDQTDTLRLSVSQPFMLPYNSIGFVRKFNQISVVQTVRKKLKKLNIKKPIVVSTVPNACDYISFFNEMKVIYYCVDDFVLWPGHDKAMIRKMEDQLIKKSNILIATSRKLRQKLSERGKPTYLLTHGVDVDLFEKVPEKEHDSINNIPRPRIGYFGLIDERSDQKLIAKLASEIKEFSFVMTGPVVTDISLLNFHSNVYFTGQVPYRELPRIIKGLSALFIPYVINDFTDAISPLKLKEYLVTGKPVISTPLAEAEIYANEIIIAKSIEEWKTALYSLLVDDFAQRKRSILAEMRNESWDIKAKQFLRLCAG